MHVNGRRRRALVMLVNVVVLGTVWGLMSAPSPALGSPAQGASAAENPWHVAATLGLGAEDTAVSCPSVAACWALESGELVLSDDGGATWSEQTSLVPTGVSALVDLDCPTTSECYLTALTDDLDPVLLSLDTDALTMQARDVPATASLETLACSGRAHCMTTDGHTIYVTDDGGMSWKISAPAQTVFSNPSLDCVFGTKTCWLVGNNGEIPLIERTTNDGKTWTAQSAPPPPLSDGLYGVECPTTKVCYVAGADMPDDAIVLGTKDAGATWSLLDLPHQDYSVNSLACTSATHCWVAGLPPSGRPSIYVTSDGQHWKAQSLPSPLVEASPELACSAARRCVAVSGGIAFTTADGGDQWSSSELPTVIGEPQALSCPTAKTCVGVVDDALGRPVALRSTSGGTSWERHQITRKASDVYDVDCPSTSVCYAVSAGPPGRPGAVVSHAFTSTDGGVSWKPRIVTRKGVLRKVSCPTTTTCLAGGYDNHSVAKLMVTTDGGSTWADVPPPSGAFSLDGLECVSPTACVVVTSAPGEPATAWTTDDLGTTYQPHQLPAERDFYDVGCAGTTCVAVGSAGGDGAVALSKDGGVTWRTQSIPSNVQILGKVSCGDPSACAATAFDFSEGGGPLIVSTANTGRTWEAFRVPARQQEPTDVACVGVRCIASEVSLAGNPLVLAGRA